MTRIIPQLVKDTETGNLCMQLRFAGYTATLPLPDDFGSWTTDRKDEFIAMAVGTMKANLIEMRRTDQRKLRRKSEGHS